MTKINQQFLDVLRSGTPSSIKLMSFRSILSSVEGAEELLAILTLANHNKWSTGKIRKLRDRMILVDEGNNLSDINLLYSNLDIDSYTARKITSEYSFEILTYLLSPLSFGISLTGLQDILSSNYLSAEQALAILDITISAPENEQKDVFSCGCCGRTVATTKKNIVTGLCTSCSRLVYEYTISRRGPFKVPLNIFNFPRFEKLSQTPVLLKVVDYAVTKVDNYLHFNHTLDFTGRFNFPLPFNEFAKRIHEV